MRKLFLEQTEFKIEEEFHLSTCHRSVPKLVLWTQVRVNSSLMDGAATKSLKCVWWKAILCTRVFVHLIQGWIMNKVPHIKWMVNIAGYRINICWAKGFMSRRTTIWTQKLRFETLIFYYILSYTPKIIYTQW